MMGGGYWRTVATYHKTVDATLEHLPRTGDALKINDRLALDVTKVEHDVSRGRGYPPRLTVRTKLESSSDSKLLEAGFTDVSEPDPEDLA